MKKRLSYHLHLAILAQFHNAGRRVGLMLLAAAPANIVDSLQDFGRNITIILCRRLTTHIGAGADQRLLEAVTQLLAERLEGDTHGQTAILCHQIIGHTRSIVEDDGCRLDRKSVV